MLCLPLTNTWSWRSSFRLLLIGEDPAGTRTHVSHNTAKYVGYPPLLWSSRTSNEDTLNRCRIYQQAQMRTEYLFYWPNWNGSGSPPVSGQRYNQQEPALEMKGRWKSNINVWFPLKFSQKWNCYFQNRIIIFCLPVPTLIISVRDLYISRISLPILLQRNMWTNPENI
jgi:hypothetical protein